MDDVALDIEHMKADLAVETDAALEVASKLALEVVDSPRKTPDSFRLAREFQERHLHVRLLRHAIKVEVAG